MLDNDSMSRTLHPPWRIEKAGRDSPQRHELPGALRQMIVASAGLETLTAFTPTSFMGLNPNLDLTGGIGVPIFTQADVFVDETDERLYSVQKGLNSEANSWSPGSFFQPVRSLIGRPKASYSFSALRCVVVGIIQPIRATLAS